MAEQLSHEERLNKNTGAYKDSDSGFLGGQHMHSETWRTSGHMNTIVDTSEHGPLSPAVDDAGVGTCKKRAWPKAPGFEGDESQACESGSLSGALDGRRGAKGHPDRHT